MPGGRIRKTAIPRGNLLIRLLPTCSACGRAVTCSGDKRPSQLLFLETNTHAATVFRNELNTSAFESNSDQL
ncbi:hypothetical protein SM11_pC1017 (plasmid) [Sinorhizobium meliloti SM11]|uniref:Uncharacterized protein n=1 Tax=Sinorhizobium meliloti (strain SM11) TaxID=707241 RepID=F7XEW5_SINMM|nr:hypothetical protein SM11_pC1017 [Sinorhizobium meliloti SM11]ARS66702.1 hypothetical protein SMRU11_04965 [Sinorhizobium meliloti RU11/001]ASP67164.1 hypothetical protein CDO29_21840 [Sinorhizobium meliloti]ASP81179.1 hypothetical protein CDO27_25460 [Sinorhizobium meliloti]